MPGLNPNGEGDPARTGPPETGVEVRAAPERGWQTLFQHRNIPAGGYSKSYSKVSENGNLEALVPIGFEFKKQALQTHLASARDAQPSRVHGLIKES